MEELNELIDYLLTEIVSKLTGCGFKSIDVWDVSVNVADEVLEHHNASKIIAKTLIDADVIKVDEEIDSIEFAVRNWIEKTATEKLESAGY